MATPETVRDSRGAVRSYLRQRVPADLTTIVVIGKVTSSAARAAIDKSFAAWRPAPAPSSTCRLCLHGRPRSQCDGSRVQDRVVLAQTLALTRSDPDYYALQLGNRCGGSFYSTRSASICARIPAWCTRCSRSCRPAERAASTWWEYAVDPQNVVKAATWSRARSRRCRTRRRADELPRVKACLLRQLPLSESGVEQDRSRLLARPDLGLGLDEPTPRLSVTSLWRRRRLQSAFRSGCVLRSWWRVSEGRRRPEAAPAYYAVLLGIDERAIYA